MYVYVCILCVTFGTNINFCVALMAQRSLSEAGAFPSHVA